MRMYYAQFTVDVHFLSFSAGTCIQYVLSLRTCLAQDVPAHSLLFCHGNFGPAEKLVRGTKMSGILVRADHFFLKIFGPPVKISVRPA